MLKKIKQISLILAFMGLLILQSCNAKKFVPQDKMLYVGADVEMVNPNEVENINDVRSEVENVLRPEPNSKFLGMRPGLWFHYKVEEDGGNFITRFFNKRFGEEPVYASDVNLEDTEDIIRNRLENRGFFYSTVASTLHENQDKKEARAEYTVEVAEPYLMESYQLDNDTMQVYREIQNNLSETVLDPGMRFDLRLLKAERERIERDLKAKGYYNFNPRFLIFEADTNQYNNKRFDLFLRLKNEVPIEAAIPYRITRVNVFPNYGVEGDTIASDTTRYEAKNFIQEVEYFKPTRLDPYLLIEEGELYSPTDSRYTSRRLATLGAYKYVNIRYDEIDSLTTDSLGILEANIFLSPLPKRSIRAELQAVTQSNGFAGPTLSASFTNRNLFKGGEILKITGLVGYERQFASGDQRGLSSIQLGAEADLIFPRMLFPIDITNDWFQYSIPKTRIGLGFNYLSRTDFYQMYSVTGRFGYTWRANRYITHELDPISINYVNLAQTTEDFEQILEENPYLRTSFEQQFIAGLTYSFTYNGMVDEQKTNQFFLNANLDVAGNTLSLFSSGSEDEPGTVLGLEYAQYTKIDADFRYHRRVGSGQKIATRLFAGYGMPYGNSDVMPFSKQYFSGGPYSIRAFRMRSLGPGSYNPQNSGIGAFFDQAGNVRLEANAEYRFPIISFLKGAVFVDSGNVWHTRNMDDEGSDEYLQKGRFESDFLKEFAVGVGFGLRVDIQNFVIRFDLANPVRTPWYPEGQRWHFDIDPVLNFGVGYPF